MGNFFTDIWEMEDLRKRVLFTLGMLGVYRLGIFVPAPGIDRTALAKWFQKADGTMFGLYDLFSGGAFSQFSVFFLGIMPYITASIIMQLAGETVPQLKRIKDEGQTGRNRITQYTRYLTILIALTQSMFISFSFETMRVETLPIVIEPGWPFRLTTMLTMTGGACFVMWLGEQMTERGVGNGSSIIITAGIIAGLPAGAAQMFQLIQVGEVTLLGASLLLAFMFAVTYAIVYVERGQRRVPLQYAKRVLGRKVYEGQTTYLPLKVNTAGVIPPIFASSLLMMPATAGQIGGDGASFAWLSALQDLKAWNWVMAGIQPGAWLYNAVYVAMVVFFAYLYTAITFNPDDVAENLKKQGGYIPKVRPGKETASYIDWILTRLTAAGSIYLAVVCIIPTLLITYFNVPFYFGGTSLLIIVGVSLDTVAQIEAQLATKHYDGVSQGGRMKGRRQQLGGQGPFV